MVVVVLDAVVVVVEVEWEEKVKRELERNV